MDELTFNKKLQQNGLTLHGACKEILIFSGAAISPDDVRKHFDRHGRLSEPTKAAFGLLFELKKLLRVRHDRAA